MRIRPNRCILWPTYSAALQLLSCPAPVGHHSCVMSGSDRESRPLSSVAPLRSGFLFQAQKKCAWPQNPPAPLRFAADFGRDRMETRSIVLSRQEKRPNCRKQGHDRTQRFTTILSRQILPAQRALPTAAYLTRSLRPTRRMVVVVMPLSWQSLLMVVWCCLAILERVSPFLMV